MISRIFLILLFVLQPALLQAGSLRSAPTGGCAMQGCGEPVEVVSCCGMRTVRTHCGEAVSECDCGMSPGDPAPSPDAPLPLQNRDTFQINWMPVPAAVLPLPATSDFARAASQSLPPRSHNETQAILCIWQT